jgi:SAM-dependent methyltransferase
MNYEFAYRIGFHPWEDAETHEPFVEKFAAVIAREQDGEPPYGSALDLGCGSGIWGIQLAKRGWRVTGVDIVEKALDRARERVADEGVEMRLVRGDVTDLSATAAGSGYRLILDTGTFHGFDSAQRTAMGREVSRISADDASVLMLSWVPKRRGPLPRGASAAEIAEAFPGWTVEDLGPSHFEAPKPIELLLRPEEHWFRLRRESSWAGDRAQG